MPRHLVRCFAILALAGAVLPAQAQSSGQQQGQPPAGERRPPPPPEGGQGGRPHREPPPFAFDGCKGKKEGDAVLLSPPNHEKVAATCMKWDDGRLFARPQRPQGQQGQQGRDDRPPPPPEKRGAADSKTK